MKYLGIMLVTLGFIGAALASVWHTDQTPWLYYLPALGVGVLGVGALKMHRRQNLGSAETHVSQVQNLTDCLQRITLALQELSQQLETSDSVEVHAEIDRRFADDLNTFVENRQSISHAYGLQAYADIMSSFAAAERYLNRVWSASADGYIDEVRSYLARAQEQFTHSLQELNNRTQNSEIRNQESESESPH
jgi:hypothetical protein